MKKLSIKSGKQFDIEESCDYFIRKCEIRNLSPRTISWHKDNFRVFQQFLNSKEIYTMSDITLKIMEEFIFHLKDDRKCKDVTINSYLRGLRVFLYFCMEENYMPKYKISLLKVTKEIKKTYTDIELNTLLKKPSLKTCEFSEYKIWVLSNYLLATGNRITSALNIKIADLDFDNGTIQVNTTKNRKAQIIPMSTALSIVLKEYLIYRKGELNDYLFCDKFGAKPDRRTYQKMIAKYNNAKGILKTSAHLYRHTFAKKWILNGGDIFRLQKILGHSDLSMVKEYVNMFGNDIAIDFNKYNPLDNMDCINSKEKIRLK